MFTSSALADAAPANRVLRVVVATLLALIPLLSVGVLTAAPANAVAQVSAGIDAANGFPSWYEDASGARVVPCLDPADPNCILAGFTPNGPVSFPDNFPDEFFYTIADTDRIRTDGCRGGIKRGDIRARFALEGAFANTAPAVGDQIVFGRMRITVRGMCPGVYTVRHPYGEAGFTVDDAGDARITTDIGCAGVPCNFGSPILDNPMFGSTDVAGSGFLRWDPAAGPAAPAGYLGDATTPHPVVGGTNGNSFSIVDENGADLGLSTDLFTVSGKIAGSLISDSSELDFGGVAVNASDVRTVTVTNLDASPVTLAEPVVGGTPEFSVSGGTCEADMELVRDATCTVEVTFAPIGDLGVRTDTLTVASTGGVRSPLTVALKGTAIEATDAPVLTAGAPSLEFGPVRVREASGTQSVTLTNTGTAPLSFTSIALDPSAAAEENANFRIVGGSCSTQGTVPAGDSCTIDAQFAPLSNGDHASAIVVATNAGAGSVALTGTGTGGTAAVGPVGAFGFPEWYRDDTGIKVGQCIDPADPYCIVLPDPGYDPANPLVFPDNFPEEFFYQVTDTEILDISDPTCSATSGRIRMRTALEAAFANGGPVDGDQMTFGRIRFSTNGGLCPDTDYYFTSPYGSDLFTADVDGVLKPTAGTQDVGCVPTPGTPCDWELALSSRVLSSLVRWDPDVAPAAPAGYLGDAVTLHKIVGAPYMPDGTTPANYFEVTRADTGERIAFTDEFTVMGKLQGPLEATPSTIDFGAVPTGSTSDPTPFSLVNTGLTDITIAAASEFVIAGTNQADFAVDPGTCAEATLAPDATCAGTVTFTPAADGPREAHLAITHDGLNNPLQIRLVGVGQAQAAAFSAAPTSVTFGPVHVGQPSEVEMVTISNVGGLAPLQVTDVALVGLEAAQYAIVGNTCMDGGLPVDVPVDGTCTVDVVFTPLEAGASEVALEFTDNATGSPQSVVITGEASAAAPLDSALLSPDNGFPMFYGDANGVRVEPCLDPTDALCVLAGFDAGGNPVDFPGNFPEEFFYSIADSDQVSVAPIDGCAVATPGTADLRIALEGTFANTTPTPGEQTTFGRTRVTADGLCPGTSYTFVTPYGPVLFAADNAGVIKATDATIDIGVDTPFDGALASPIAQSFPRWNPNVAPAAPAGYLGDPRAAHTIVGGTHVPDGASGAFNGFEVRNGAGELLGGTDQFIVSGKLAASLHNSASALDFGNLNIGVPSDPQTVTLTNTGPPVAITDVETAGTNAAEFQVGGTCAVDLTLLTDDTCTVEVRFAPADPTGSKAATVTVTPAAGAPVSIDLGGIADGTGDPVATITPAALDFGNVNVGSPASKDVTIVNTGIGDLTIVDPPVLSGPDLADYAMTANTCTAVVVPGSSCRIGVTFTPSAAGTLGASLEITYNAAGSPRTVSMTGFGVASSFSVSPTNVKFGKVRLGTAKAGSVKVKNTGSIPFTPSAAVSSDPAFVVGASPNCLGVPLAPGQTCQVDITFTPTSRTNYNATLTMYGDTSSDPAGVIVNMSGTGR